MLRNQQPYIDHGETLDEAYERTRIESLPEPLQQLVYQHHLGQYEAVPSYCEQQAQHRQERQAQHRQERPTKCATR